MILAQNWPKMQNPRDTALTTILQAILRIFNYDVYFFKWNFYFCGKL